jgi:hypothetical protein
LRGGEATAAGEEVGDAAAAAHGFGECSAGEAELFECEIDGFLWRGIVEAVAAGFFVSFDENREELEAIVFGGASAVGAIEQRADFAECAVILVPSVVVIGGGRCRYGASVWCRTVGRERNR